MIRLLAPYRHYKGGIYVPTAIMKLTDDAKAGDLLVGYYGLEGEIGHHWARPEPMWEEEVRMPLVGGEAQVGPRFCLMRPDNLPALGMRYHRP